MPLDALRSLLVSEQSVKKRDGAMTLTAFTEFLL